MPSFAHQHPYGLRRHRRRGLFATLIAQDAFCRTALGLGADRRQRQLRATARASLQSLRIDAWRILIIDALAHRPEATLDVAASTSQRLFGEPAPPELVGALPILHQPASGAAFVGQLLAVADHHALVQAYDEDWFRNPAAAEELRAADAAMRPLTPPPARIAETRRRCQPRRASRCQPRRASRQQPRTRPDDGGTATRNEAWLRVSGDPTKLADAGALF